jgi:hypothetical protein
MMYTCNGSPTGCESERFGGCAYHEGRTIFGLIHPEVERDLIDAASSVADALNKTPREMVRWLRDIAEAAQEESP